MPCTVGRSRLATNPLARSDGIAQNFDRVGRSNLPADWVKSNAPSRRPDIFISPFAHGDLFANGKQAVRDRHRHRGRGRRRYVGRHRGLRCRSARHRLREGPRAWRRGHYFRRRLPDRRVAVAEGARHPGHARPGLQRLDQMGRPVGRRSLGALLHRAHPSRSLSLGRRPRREVGRPESPGGQLRAALDPCRAQRAGPHDAPHRQLPQEGRRDRSRNGNHRR